MKDDTQLCMAQAGPPEWMKMEVVGQMSAHVRCKIKRERFTDGLIVEFRVTQVRVHRVFVAGVLLADDFGCLRVVEVVKELGLMTCGRSELCQGAKLLV